MSRGSVSFPFVPNYLLFPKTLFQGMKMYYRVFRGILAPGQWWSWYSKHNKAPRVNIKKKYLFSNRVRKAQQIYFFAFFKFFLVLISLLIKDFKPKSPKNTFMLPYMFN
jgi:hypothetical protein